ncbi:fused MFS/spermidine synthase [Ideonella sp.]|uniref:fused MFS/spermidine synthase n=1 Tax=Ideonella sp. TaxID=1929293 RepID=UPI0035AFC05A
MSELQWQARRGFRTDPVGAAAAAGWSVRLLFVGCIFTSAFLLFLVQPIIAKQVMPWFGGTSGVWTTCLMFFQLVLLAGYGYSDGATRRLSPPRHAALHVLLLVLAVATLPITPGEALKPDPARPPIGDLVLLLAATVGLPYFCLSTTGPLLQAWYARLFPGSRVYRLFALSNLASLAGLLAYPFLIEPYSSSLQQSRAWSVGFVVFAVLCAGCAWASRRAAPVPTVGGAPAGAAPPAAAAGDRSARAPRVGEQALWWLLSGLGSALLLAITQHMTQNVAAVPLLWLLPLSLYLLSFVLCFEGRGAYRRSVFTGPLILSLVVLAWGMNVHSREVDITLAVPAFSIAFFICCMFLHGELAMRKPAPRHLTRFYLGLSAGGAVGGLLVSALAPLLLDHYYELPLLLVAVAVLMLVLLKDYFTANLAALGVLAFAVMATVLTVLMAWVFHQRQAQDTLAMMRNFYAASRVAQYTNDHGDTVRALYNGSIVHGTQIVSDDPARRRTPTTYYGAGSGVALAMNHLAGAPRSVGVIGLGVGTLAAYGQPGDEFRFYEINPHSQAIAERDFSYLRESPARHEVVLGDARMNLQAEADQGRPQAFDLLVVDAFSGDSIPVHLITQEALAVYRRHVKPHGLIAFHVSNLFLDLEPVVQQLAADAGLQAVYLRAPARYPETASVWVIVTDDPAFLADPQVQARRQPITPIPGLTLWTDASNNLVKVLH